MPGMGEFWIVIGYDEVVEVLTDRRLSNSVKHMAQETIEPAADEGDRSFEHSLLVIDPPEHTRLRRLVSKAFTARRVATLRPRVQQIADGLLDSIAPRGQADLVADLAFPLTIAVISELLGVPLSDRDDFRRWSVAITFPPAEPEMLRAAAQAQRDLEEYFESLIARKRADPQDDLLSELARMSAEEQALSDPELIGLAGLFVLAGHDTTVNLIGNGMLALLRNPDQLSAVRTGVAPLSSVIEELLRYVGPVSLGLARFTTQDIEIAGISIPKGQVVIASLAAANRDPARFSRAELLDVTRDEGPHLEFGHGIHFCLGAALARLEAVIAIGSLIQRFPELELTVPAERLRWRSGSLRGVAELPVSFSSAS